MQWTIPNALSLFRVVASPFLLAIAWAGWPSAFLVLLAATLLSDSLDGFLARRLHTESTTGARLDSLGDMSIVLALPISVVLLWPHIVQQEMPFIVAAVLSYCVPTIFGAVKYGKATSYHTWGAKATAVITGASLMVLLLEISPWPFRLCVPLMIVEGVEEIVMTCMLREWHANVPTSWHAYRLRRQERRGDGT